MIRLISDFRFRLIRLKMTEGLHSSSHYRAADVSRSVIL